MFVRFLRGKEANALGFGLLPSVVTDLWPGGVLSPNVPCLEVAERKKCYRRALGSGYIGVGGLFWNLKSSISRRGKKKKA